MANGSTRYIIKYVGDISDVLAKIRTLRRATNTLGRSGARNMAPLTQSMERTSKALDKTAKSSNRAAGGFKGLFVRAIKTIPIWLALRAGVTSVTKVLRASISFLVQWENQMAQIRIVGEATTGQMETLSQGLLNLQRTLGISNKDIGEGAKLFRQQGRAIEEIIPLLDATARLSLITGRNITQSVEDLTAILKAFNIEASDSITIVDRLTAVTLQNSITAGDLASGLKQSASTAATFGVSLDELIGFITAIKTQTRDTGNTVGRSLRTIFVRLGTVAVDTAQQVAKVPFFLDQLGDVTTKRTPKLRNLTSIVTELAASFRNLESAERAQLAASVAGVRRSNQITALFQNFEQFISSQIQAQFGLGEADRAVDILTQTTVSKIEQVKGSWNSLLDTFADTGAFKATLDSTKNTLDGIRLAIDPQGTFETSLISQLGKDAENLTRQATGIQAVFKEIDNLREVNASLRRNPSDESLLGFSLVRVRELQGAISRFERQNNISLGIEGLDDVRNTFDLLNLLEGQTSELTDTLLRVTVETNIAQATQELQSGTAQLRRDLENIFGQQISNAIDIKFKGFDPENERELGAISQLISDLSDPTQTGRVVANFDNIRKALEALEVPDNQLDIVLSGLKSIEQTQGAINREREQGIEIAKEELKNAEQIASTSIVEGEVKERLLKIDLEAVRTDASKLAIAEQKLALLNDENSQLSREQEQIKDTLELERERILASRELARERGNEELILQQLVRNGASAIEIEQQRLALIRERKGLDSKEAIEQEGKIRELSLKRELEIETQLLGVATDLLSIEGQRKSQIIQSQIELEKGLGRGRQGVDALKQQVQLLKALKSEQQGFNRESQLSALQKAIAGARRDQSSSLNIRNDFRESRLRQEAQSLGIDADSFLFDNSELIDKTERNIQSLIGNIDSNIRLTGSIDHLTNTILRQESRLSSEQIVRATVQAGTPNSLLGGSIQTTPTQLDPIGNIPAISRGRTIGPPGGQLVQVNIGNTEVFLSKTLTDGEIQQFVKDTLNEDNDRRTKSISDNLAKQLRTPETRLNKSDTENLERF